MLRKRLLLLIILSSVSILVLIVLQVYWIKKNAETQRQNFEQNVMHSMQNVVRKLDREVAVTKITSTLFDDETLFNSLKSDPNIKVNRKEEDILENALNPTIGRIPSDYFQIEFKPPPKSDSSFFIIRETSKRMLSSSIESSYPEDSIFSTQLRKKATLVNDLVKELALISINKQEREEVSYEKIDSLLYNELTINGIKTDYVFDVLDIETNRLTFSEEDGANSEIQNTSFRISLFPNNYSLDSDQLLLYFPDKDSYLIQNGWKILLVSIVLICIIIALFYTSITTIYKQKKLSLVKNDFINNMTHELKTPISTISLACEALADEHLKLDAERQQSYVGMIQDENKRLSVLVDNVLKSAVWDSTKLILSFKKVNLHELIKKVADSFDIQIERKEGQIKLELNATKSTINADKVHLSNVIYNLLDNANKYTPSKPIIKLKTDTNENFIIFSVSDNGIGIKKENLNKVFDKFYRVSTGNIHDVKGFGLGLSYVKRIVELHHGEITIESLKGKGTILNIKLPIDGK